ncbi:hypothetical protein L6452_15152 [Arctium lappa]|uniref:Uncharacterized protein n=1 Tax=Arctium lappa TaxID=4217 RepID=A0ACB9CMT4_ARCLA|nr:hypothetical protein L6452_15152 [Arctium lappa]
MDRKVSVNNKPTSKGKDCSFAGGDSGDVIRDNRSYSAVVKGRDSIMNRQGKQTYTATRRNGNNGVEETRTIEVDTDEVTKDILKRSLIGEAKNFDHLDNFAEICKDIGLSTAQIKHIGGKEVLLVLDNEAAVDAIVKNSKHEIRQWLWNLRKWDEFYSPEGRITWVQIIEVPVHCWNNSTFRRITEIWGTVLGTKNCSIVEGQSLVVGKVLLQTIDVTPIEESLIVKCGEKSFQVRITENFKDIVELEIAKESDSDDSSEPGDALNYQSEEDGSSSKEEDGIADTPILGMDMDDEPEIGKNSSEQAVEGHRRPGVAVVGSNPEDPRVVVSTFEDENVKTSNLENMCNEAQVDVSSLDPIIGLDLNQDPMGEPTSSIGNRGVGPKDNIGKGVSVDIPKQNNTQTPFSSFTHSSFSFGNGLVDVSKRKLSGGIKGRIPFGRNKIWNERTGNNSRRSKISSSIDHTSTMLESSSRKRPRTSMSIGSSSEGLSHHSASQGTPLDPDSIVNLGKEIGFTWDNSVGVHDQTDPPTGGQS